MRAENNCSVWSGPSGPRRHENTGDNKPLRSFRGFKVEARVNRETKEQEISGRVDRPPPSPKTDGGELDAVTSALRENVDDFL